ncbi:MAG: LuxR C-terminal-related transcriptional regulator [Spirochaetia bacterium]|nr:LuxR C-terminal-related transcriptional regulator [Spirochaetia bacterium]MCF7946739.1 LuxR C-terminal-related transcriptional regulator [Spirochaetia bacterium]
MRTEILNVLSSCSDELNVFFSRSLSDYMKAVYREYPLNPGPDKAYHNTSNTLIKERRNTHFFCIDIDAVRSSKTGFKDVIYLLRKNFSVLTYFNYPYDNKDKSLLSALGVRDTIFLETPKKEITYKIRNFFQGGVYSDSETQQEVSKNKLEHKKYPVQVKLLSRREIQIMIMISQGKTSKFMAVELSISVNTVETYKNRIKKKLNLDSIASITRYAIASGLDEDIKN